MPNPVYGRIKAGKAPFINYAAKYLVCGELRRRDIAAAPGPMNDGRIVVVDRPSATVRVKAMTTATKNGWVWMAREDGSLFRDVKTDDFTVLVDLGDGSRPVEYFIVPTRELERKLRRDFKKWFETSSPTGRPHSPSNRMYRIGYDESQWRWLESYRDWSPMLDRLEVN